MFDYLSVNSHNLPECIVCANDELAIGVIKALKKFDIKIPDQVKVTGFDDIELARYIYPSLSTVRVNYFNYGREVGKLAIKILNGENVENKINIDVELIDRKSS